jgi:transcriptional regulator with XRE-family HTH domain
LEAQEQLAARHIALRERAGLTQEQEARRAGVSPTTISGIESGKITRPHLKTLLKLARALGADVGELRESGKVEAPPSQDKLFNNGSSEEERRFIDYRRCREALDRFCDYWEQVLTEDRLDRRACEEFEVAAKLASELLVELWAAERVDVRIRHGEDRRLIDKSEPWPSGLMDESELWPAIDRWMAIGLHVNQVAKERFAEDIVADDPAMGQLLELRRKSA